MQRRLLLVLALLVTVPTLTVVTLGWRMLENQRRVARMELETLLDERLADLEQTIAAELTRLEQDLAAQTDPELGNQTGAPPTAEALRQLRRESGLVGMAFVLDPQGKAIEGALSSLGFAGVSNVRQGKVFDFEIAEKDPATAANMLQDMCEKLLANTVIEDYRIEMV